MIANFGYKDGSGEFFITIDTDKCNGCGDCIPVCPSGVLDIVENEYDPLADEKMAVVKDEHRKKIKYTHVFMLPCISRLTFEILLLRKINKLTKDIIAI